MGSDLYELGRERDLCFSVCCDLCGDELRCVGVMEGEDCLATLGRFSRVNVQRRKDWLRQKPNEDRL